MFDCRSEFPGQKLNNDFIEEEYGILDKPAISVKPKRIHQVLGNFIKMIELDNNDVYED